MLTKITKLDSEAVGVCKIDDKTTLVNKVLPNEEINIAEFENKGKYNICTKYLLINSNLDRVEPSCKYYNKCGGCNLQHANYNFQKQFKIKKVLDAFKYICGKQLNCDEFIESEKLFEYRNKIVFAIKDYTCGMYESNSRNFVKIDNCKLVSKSLNEFFAIVANWVFKYKIDLNHIALREVNGKFICVLIGVKRPEINNLINELDKEYKNCYQIVFNNNDAKNDLITHKIEVLHGTDIDAKYQNLTYPVSANSFLQVNENVSKKLYDKVLSNINNNVVINAYSGAGVLSAILATKAKKVYGVEVVKNAHSNAENLKKNNNIHNLINICGKAEVELPKILKQEKSITLVIDPPRKGVDNKLLKLINSSTNIDKIIYIACSPNSLAKNYNLLNSYKITSLNIYDMFPQTSHVETLVCLNKLV